MTVHSCGDVVVSRENCGRRIHDVARCRRAATEALVVPSMLNLERPNVYLIMRISFSNK